MPAMHLQCVALTATLTALHPASSSIPHDNALPLLWFATRHVSHTTKLTMRTFGMFDLCKYPGASKQCARSRLTQHSTRKQL